jgi:hypothetical protein
MVLNRTGQVGLRAGADDEQNYEATKDTKGQSGGA